MAEQIFDGLFNFCQPSEVYRGQTWLFYCFFLSFPESIDIILEMQML